jgi:hypothetical protein
MSRDIKYIGMDVHKEATVVAVLNGSGKLVMESIVETKASSILHLNRVNESDQSSVSRPEHPMWGYPGLCSALSRGMVTQD